MQQISVGTVNDANPFVMGSFLGGYSLPAYGTPLLGGYPYPAYGYAYIPPWVYQQRSIARNPSKKTKITDKISKKSRNKATMMTVVNPAPRPVPVPPGCYSKKVGGKTVIVCPPTDITAPTADPFGTAPVPRHDPRFPGGTRTCAEACGRIYSDPWQFPEWEECYSRCQSLYGGMGHRPGPRPVGRAMVVTLPRSPNPAMVPVTKLGGKALRQRSDHVLSLLVNMKERDHAAVKDPRTALAIRALKTARTSQERREAIAIARSLVADWDRWDGSRRFTGPGAALAYPASDDELRLVVQPVVGKKARILICSRNHCCVVERPGDLWRCIREIRATKKAKPSIARNPVDWLCFCDNPDGTDCKCTVCWQKKRGAAHKPSCYQFDVPDAPGPPGTPPDPRKRRYARRARIRHMMASTPGSLAGVARAQPVL